MGASKSVVLMIAAEQQAGTVAFATLFGERIEPLETYLATKRSNLVRFLRHGQAVSGLPLVATQAEYAQLGRDADEAVAIRAEFDQYALRQEILARRLLLPLAMGHTRLGRGSIEHPSVEGIRRITRGASRRFEGARRSTLLVRSIAAAAAFGLVLSWSVSARGSDVTAAAPAPSAQIASPAPDDPLPAAAIVWTPSSVLDHGRIVALYGHPGQPTMGVLGKYTPQEAAQEAARLASTGTQPGAPALRGALELIVAVAQAKPTADGLYLERMPDSEVARYVEAAREHGLQLILDIQIGWGDPLLEAKRYERFLVNPFVHIALDPEFATRRLGVAPGVAIGSLDAHSVNEVEEYLGGLVRVHHLPKKLLILHQFTPDMLPDTSRYRGDPAVERVIDMDGFGPPGAKLDAYNEFALAPYGHYPAIKLFFECDEPLLANAQLDALARPPALLIYQ